jgi:steroid delta-isomerase
MADVAAMKSAVEAYTACHSAGDVDGIMALFSENAIAHDPIGSPPHVGYEGVRAFFAATHDMVDSLTLTLTGPIRCAGEFAAFPMTARSVIGGSALEIDIIDVMTFDEDGKISEMKAYWNMGDARQG